MKLTIHEVARVVGAKNDVTVFSDDSLNKAEFDNPIFMQVVFNLEKGIRVHLVSRVKSFFISHVSSPCDTGRTPGAYGRQATSL